jgi:hypothetical protein
MKKEIQGKKRRKEDIDEKEAFISRATFHILNAIKFIISDEEENIRQNYTDIKEIDVKIAELYTERIHDIMNKAIFYVGDVVKQAQKDRGDRYTHDKFFKEIGTNKMIRDYVLKKLAAEH